MDPKIASPLKQYLVTQMNGKKHVIKLKKNIRMQWEISFIMSIGNGISLTSQYKK